MRRTLSPLGLAALAVCLASAACGSGKSPVAQPKPSASAVASGPPEPACAPIASEKLPPEFVRAREASVGALLSGQSQVAIASLRTLTRARPENVGVFALLAAAQTQSSVDWSKTSSEIGSTAVTTIADVPNGRAVHAPVSFDAAERSFELGAPITRPHTVDETTWFARQGLETPGTLDGNEAAFGAVVDGESLMSAFHYADHQAYVFGEHVVGVRARDGAVFTILSFSQGEAGFRVQAAQVAGDALIVEIVGPDPESGEADGFLAAVDLATAQFRWIGDHHTATAASFVIAGHYAVTGADADERGSIQVIDLVDGKVKTRVPIAADPTYIVAKDGRILVFASAVEIAIPTTPALPPAARARLDEHAGADASQLAYQKCTLGRALAALDARDGRSAMMELGVLQDQRAPAVVALRAAADFLDRASSDPGSFVDLSAKSPFRIDIKTSAVPRAEAKLGPLPDLSKKTTIPAHVPPPKAPKKRGPLDPSPEVGAELVPPPMIDPQQAVEFEMPDSYGDATLSSQVAMPGGNILVYGNEYIAVLEGMRTRAVFDFSGLVHPNGRPADVNAGIGPAITDVATNGSLLFVSIGVANESYTMTSETGYVAAFDLDTGALVWKTGPLVSTTEIVLLGDYVVTAGGAEGGSGNLFVLRSDTGATASRLALPSAPTHLGMSGSNLAVITPTDYFLFALGGAAPKAQPHPTPRPPAKIDF